MEAGRRAAEEMDEEKRAAEEASYLLLKFSIWIVPISAILWSEIRHAAGLPAAVATAQYLLPIYLACAGFAIYTTLAAVKASSYKMFTSARLFRGFFLVKLAIIGALFVYVCVSIHGYAAILEASAIMLRCPDHQGGDCLIILYGAAVRHIARV